MPETSVAYYEHYPVSPEDVIAHVVHIQTSTVNISEVITQVQTDMATATAAVEGQLEGPLADAPVMVITMGAEVEATARHRCGCLLYFAQAIIDYDLGIDGLNQQILAPIEAGTTPNPDSAVVRRKGQLDVTLDDEATLVAQMLGRGPNAQDAAFLEQEGAIVSDPLGSAHATPGSGAVLCRQASPEEAAAYWAALSPAERAAVIQQYPDVIGATDGLPAGARDEANRILLQRDLALPDGDPRRENAETVSASLTRIETEHFDPRTGQPVEAQLRPRRRLSTRSAQRCSGPGWAQRYAVSTFCRIPHTLDTGQVTSKKAAMLWAGDALDPRWAGLIQQVLDDRPLGFDADAPPRPGSAEVTLAFAAYAQSRAAGMPSTRDSTD